MLGPLTTEQRERLLTFVGYGRLDAPVWFLGMEEAGGGEENLRIRAGFRQVEDLKVAHEALGITKHHTGRRVLQRTWAPMCHIMLDLNGIEDQDRESRRYYQSEMLGRLDGQTLLAELFPIPKPRIDLFDYPDSFPEYRTAEDYYADVSEMRVNLLKRLLQDSQPRVVIAYGSAFWHHYQRVLGDVTLSGDRDLRYGRSPTTLVILTHHLFVRQLNGRFGDFARIIREGCPHFELS